MACRSTSCRLLILLTSSSLFLYLFSPYFDAKTYKVRSRSQVRVNLPFVNVNVNLNGPHQEEREHNSMNVSMMSDHEGSPMPTELQDLAEDKGLSTKLEDLVEECLKATHISSIFPSSLVENAKNNSRYLYDEYRSVIPNRSLDGYGSYCWEKPFSLQWDNLTLSGHIGSILYRQERKNIFTPKVYIDNWTSTVPGNAFKTDLVCLPKVFMAGFYKCGSSFLYCLLNKLTSISTNCSLSSKTIVKEPRSWLKMYSNENSRVPIRSDVMTYIFNFLPGLRRIVKSNEQSSILVHGKPNIIAEWPRFRYTSIGEEFTNYCLLPSVIPQLFTGSKFFVIMREPVNMLYSNFWYSCMLNNVYLSEATKLDGPNIFHDRVMSKIQTFNDCMRDSSVPAINQACQLGGKYNYNSCILQRIHLLDKCAEEMNYHMTSPGMSNCGFTALARGLYFIHVRKWLSIVSRDRFHFLVMEDLIQNLSQNSRDILEFLDLNTDIASNTGFIEKAASDCKSVALVSSIYKHDPRLKMRKDTRRILESFYEPFNSLLFNLLGGKIATKKWRYMY